MDDSSISASPSAHDDEQEERRAQLRARADFLRAVPILRGLDESVLWLLAEHSEERVFGPGTRVLAEGDESHTFYVIRSGQADVLQDCFAGGTEPVARLGVGSYFGELGLLTNRRRNASVKVSDGAPLRALAWDGQLFHEVIAENVLVFRLQRQQRRQRRGRTAPGLRLHELDVLRDMPPADMAELQRAARHERWATGETIFEQGDTGDRFYVVLDGEVTIERDGEPLAQLHSGDFFGETALLFQRPRMATARAATDTVVWSITRSAFQRIVGYYLLGRADLRPVVLSRLQGDQ